MKQTKETFSWKVWVDIKIAGEKMTRVQEFFVNSAAVLPHPFRKESATVEGMRNTLNYLKANGFNIVRVERKPFHCWTDVTEDIMADGEPREVIDVADVDWKRLRELKFGLLTSMARCADEDKQYLEEALDFLGLIQNKAANTLGDSRVFGKDKRKV